MGLLINKNYFLVWTGQIVSQLGDRFYSIAIAWWLLEKTGSPSIMGLSLMFSLLPEALFGLFSGVLIDKNNPKTVIVLSDVVRAIIILFVSVSLYFNYLHVWQVFAANSLISTISALFNPAIMSIIPGIVKEAELDKANSLSQMITGITTIVGPLFGSGLAATIGLFPILLFNSISFLLSALFESFISYKQKTPISHKYYQILFILKEGFSFIMNNNILTVVMKIIAAIHLFVGSLMILIPFLATDIRGSGINNLGFLEMALGAGLVLGSFIYMSLKIKQSGRVKIIIFSFLIISICFLILGFIHGKTVDFLIPYILILIAIGGSVSIITTNWRTILQLSTPKNLRGRVFSAANAVANLTLPLGIVIYGFLMELILPAYVTISSGFAIMGVTVYFGLTCLKKIVVRSAEDVHYR